MRNDLARIADPDDSIGLDAQLGEALLCLARLLLVERRRVDRIDRAHALARRNERPCDARNRHLGAERLRELGGALERMVGGRRRVVSEHDVFHG